MTKKSTKRALLASLLALVVSISMLIGTTFAWFTDNVISGRNLIQSGNLDVELEYYDEVADKWVAVDEDTDAFGYTNWEPGFAKVVKFRVTNKGSLALKYQLTADVYTEDAGVNKAGENFLLSDYLYTAVVAADADRDTVLGTTGINLKDSYQMSAKSLEKGASEELGLAIWMPCEVDNVANHDGVHIPSIEFGVRLVAAQFTSESDSYGNDYDADAKYPMGRPGTVKKEFNGYEAKVDIPAEAPEYDYDLEISDIEYVTDGGNATVKFDMSLVDKSSGEVPPSSLQYPVKIQLPHPFVDMNGFEVLHNGEPVEGATYDEETNTVSFTTSHFSPFEIKYVDYVDPSFELGYEENADGSYTIIKGMFFGKNPVDFDATLKEADSDYIAVDYEKDGITYYVVSEKASTVFVSNNESTTEYVGENGTFPVTYLTDAKLYTVFTAGYRTIYIMPGEYKTGTTLTISADMDIIGLGDTGTVKLTKLGAHSTTSKKPSNRHLFNCTNNDSTKYIEVTIRNLSIDATEKNSYIGKVLGKEKQLFEDNAAVQAIRRAKVKCYDLNIIKLENDMASVAFYVNGSNKADDGKAYPVYLYAEDCALNSKKDVSFVTTSGSYKFYHSGLTYDGKDYTKNSGNIKNLQLAADDWDW